MKDFNEIKIFPLGAGALTVDFGNIISLEINNLVLRLAQNLNNNPFAGFIETVPAYSSLTIFFDVLKVRRAFSNSKTAFEAVKEIVENVVLNLDSIPEKEARLIEIPVCFDDEFALDLEHVATENNLTKKQVIEIFTARTYRVYMLGFLPGFAYMGEVDASIATPRKQTPRTSVPKGSVGIAGRQTGIYPLASPGGWQIIGKTSVELFTPNLEKPTFLQAGDLVRFKRQKPAREQGREKV